MSAGGKITASPDSFVHVHGFGKLQWDQILPEIHLRIDFRHFADPTSRLSYLYFTRVCGSFLAQSTPKAHLRMPEVRSCFPVWSIGFPVVSFVWCSILQYSSRNHIRHLSNISSDLHMIQSSGSPCYCWYLRESDEGRERCQNSGTLVRTLKIQGSLHQLRQILLNPGAPTLGPKVCK